VQCASCHAAGRYAGTPTDCASCHLARYNVTTSPNHAAAAFPRDCALCHTTLQWRGASFSHARFALTGAHQQVQCANCHAAGRYAGTPTECASCHLARYNAAVSPNHVAAAFPRDCALCHNTVRWRGVVFSHSRFPIYSGTHATKWSSCASCHVNPSNFKDFSCLGCHAKTRTDDKHRQVRGYAYVSAACYSCHPTGKD
jgi:hypothetical protein